MNTSTVAALLLTASTALVLPAGVLAAPAQDTPTTNQCSVQLKQMQDLHAKIAAAKTPAERQKLLTEQHKLMQAMMSSMSTMMSQGGAGMMGHGNMMEGPDKDSTGNMMQRMDMMQQMMQGMMDQQMGSGMMGK